MMKKVKKCICLLAAVCILLSLLSAFSSAQDIIAYGECSTDITWTLDTEGTLSIQGTGEMFYEQYLRVSIEGAVYWYQNGSWNLQGVAGNDHYPPYTKEYKTPWYDYRSSIKEVYIGNGVTTIGYKAFMGCDSLETVIVGSGLRDIGINAFRSCSNLKSFYTTSDSLSNIKYGAFYGCKQLSSFEFPNNLKKIEENAFYNCDGLTSIAIPDSVRSIEKSAFESCDGLQIVTIGSGEKNIGESAFRGCKALKSVAINSGSLGNTVFKQCSALENITIGCNVTSIADDVFSECPEIKSITVDPGNTIYHSSGNCLIQTNSKTLLLGSHNSRIPSDGSVTSIKDYAFYMCTGLTAIMLPTSLTSMGNYAFYRCTGLTALAVASGNNVYYSSGNCIIETASKTLVLGCKNSKIPTNGSVTSIGNCAFLGCAELHGITLPNSVTSIGANAFLGCTGLTEISLPVNVTSLGGSAFNGCTGLTEVTIPANVTNMGSGVFRGCDNLQTVIFADGMVTIPNNALYYSSVKKAVIPESVTSIGENAFRKSAFSVFVIPEGVTTIGSNAFYECASLSAVTIPGSVQSIGDHAFSYSGLQSVIIENGVNSIGTGSCYVFSYCTELRSVVIPKSVKTIGSYAFQGCSALSEVYYNGSETDWSAIPNSGNNSSLYSANRHYNTDGTEGACGESLTYHISSNGVLTISGTGTMYDYNSNQIPWFPRKAFIKTLIINDGVTKISRYAFKECTALTNVVIPDGVTSVQSKAFAGCENLTQVTFGKGLKTVTKDSFENCPNLTTVVFSEGVTTIPEYALYCVSSVTEVILPDSVTSIGTSAFEGTSLTEINLPAGITEIGEKAFCDCTALSDIVLPENLQRIGASAFLRCTGLSELTIPAGVTTLSGGIMAGCVNLKTITFAEGTTVIPDSALNGATYVTTVNLPEGVTSIGESAFSYCENISSIVVPGSIRRIGDWAFYGCDRLADVFYNGTQENWRAVEVGEVNDSLFDAVWHYVPSKMSPPTGVTVKPTAEKQLTVRWAAVEYATQYNVYRYNGTEYKYIGTTFDSDPNPTSYVNGGLTKGVTYYYKVVAVYKRNGRTVVSPLSTSAHAMALGKPAVPQNVKAAAAGDKALTVSWSAVTGATQYNVYRYNGTTKTYVYKGTTFATAEKPTQYVDTGLAVGTTYYYKVLAACKGNGLTFVGDLSAAANAKVLGKPAVPQNVKAAAAGDKALTVSWSAVTGATQYNVYRYRGSDKQYHYVGTTFATATKPTQYVDTGLAVGATYYYKVVAACKGNGLTFVGDMSAAANAKVLGKPGVPQNVKATAAVKQITVSWNNVAGATQYNVYRYRGSDKQYHYVGTTFATATKPTQYVDTGLATGTTYYYKVKAVCKGNGLTFTGDFSAAASAKVK